MALAAALALAALRARVPVVAAAVAARLVAVAVAAMAGDKGTRLGTNIGWRVGPALRAIHVSCRHPSSGQSTPTFSGDNDPAQRRGVAMTDVKEVTEVLWFNKEKGLGSNSFYHH